MLSFQEPFSAFSHWYAEAVRSEPSEPDAMALATVDASGRPSVRMVLMKGMNEDGLTFYTNLGSRKAAALDLNRFASVVFHWRSLQRQVVVEGAVEPVMPFEADEYFRSRPRGSQVGAWASDQGKVLGSRLELEQRVTEYERKFEGAEVPRPPHWSGFRMVPDRFEFWQGMASRLHVRTEYRRVDGAWEAVTLFP